MNYSKSALALFVCVVTFASCSFSTKNKKIVNPLIGQWKIDSVSSKNSNDLGALLLAMSLQDSAQYDIVFTPETLSVLQKDTIPKINYHFDDKKSELHILDNSTSYIFHHLTDCLVTLTAKDSTVLFLKRAECSY
jgi:hypothetical protein